VRTWSPRPPSLRASRVFDAATARAGPQWVVRVLTLEAAKGSMHLEETPEIEAEIFPSAVYGAMPTARAFDDPARFSAVVEAFLRRIRIPVRP
jgi:hypothetical protein